MQKIFSNYGIDIQHNQVNMLQIYYHLLLEWNTKINLTTITEYNEIVKKHFLDSCLLLKVYSKEKFSKSNIIDVGTGAGFPGIPLSILLPDAQFTLLDSLNKRIEFLSVLVDKLDLKNVTLIHGRAEEYRKNEAYREKFDYCVSRAVAPLSLLLEYCSPFIKVDGSLLLYKSRKVEQEIKEGENALHVLKCKFVENLQLANEDNFQRNLLNICKFEHTPNKYPRKAGKPKKYPL